MASEPAPAQTHAKPPGNSTSPRRASGDLRVRRPAIVVAALAGLLACVLGVARPAWRATERWRAASLVRQADELARQQRFPDAIKRYQSATALDPLRIEAYRSLAAIYSTFEKPAAIPAWRALLQLPNHSEQDTLGFLRYSLRIQRFDLAETLLANLLSRTNPSPTVRVIATDFFTQQGDPRRALAFAEEALRSEPTNIVHQLRVVRVLLSIPDAHHQNQGFARLAGLPPTTAPQRLDILQALATAPSLPPAETLAFLNSLPRLAPTNCGDELAIIDVRLRLVPDPASRDALIQNTLERFRGSDVNDRACLVRWLLQHREPSRVLEICTLDDALSAPSLALPYLDALGFDRRWPDILTATSRSLPIDPWQLDAFRAGAASRLSQDGLAKEHWRRAFEHARTDPDRLLAVGDIAFRLEIWDKAISAYDKLAENDFRRITALRRLARVYEHLRDTERLRRLMLQWSLYDPDDPDPDSTYAYLNALLRKDLDQARVRISRLVETHPSRGAYRATLALIELYRQQPMAALELIRRLGDDAASQTPRIRLVRAVVLNANGQTAAAREAVQNLRPEELLPEEKDLLLKIAPR